MNDHTHGTTREVTVRLDHTQYPIVIGYDVFGHVPDLLSGRCPGNRVGIVTDDIVAPLYLEKLVTIFKENGYDDVEAMTIPAGEPSKSLEEAGRLYEQLADLRFERTTPLIALGGGVVGDLTGFVAATWLRGVPFAQVPTTLEAAIDASIGGKTAIDLSAGKNLVGAFYQPQFVLIDAACLETLDPRDVRAGLAESVKHGIIRDADFFAFHRDNADAILQLDTQVMSELIERNCRIKADVVAADERESGVRALLNFGHTVGHAVETLGGYEAYRHGEGVAIGMIAAMQIATGRGLTSEEQRQAVQQTLELLNLPVAVEGKLPVDECLRVMRVDKKVQHGQIRFVLPRGIGQADVFDDVTDDEIADALAAIGVS